MLWESSKMEQRYDAVLGVIRDGFSVTEVAQKFGVSRQSVRSWLQRYEAGGLEALGERSTRPLTSPTQIAESLEARSRTASSSPQLGCGDAALSPSKRRRRPTALGVLDLPRTATKWPHRGEGATQEAPDLQALGTRAGHGTLADGRGGRCALRRRHRVQDPHRH